MKSGWLEKEKMKLKKGTFKIKLAQRKTYECKVG